MVKLRLSPLILLCALFTTGANLLAADGSAPLRVALSGSPPFVIPSGGGVYTGFSVEVWQSIAAKNSWNFQYTFYPNQLDAVKAVTSGKADLVVGDVAILSSLFGTVEFSQPYYHSGLQIMVTEKRPHTVGRFFEDVLSWLLSGVFWTVVGIIIVVSILVALFERKHNPDFPKTWRDGLAEAFYNVVSLSLGKSSYKGFPGWRGRLVMTFWTVLGVVVVVYVTANLASTMTTESLESKINGPDDLPGNTVGAVTGSAAILYLQKHDIPIHEYSDLPGAAGALVKGKIPAIVGAAPLLQYYDNSHLALPITEVGNIFDRYNYGFAMPVGSPLRAPLNAALVTLQETNVVTQFGLKYFGSVYVP